MRKPYFRRSSTELGQASMPSHLSNDVDVLRRKFLMWLLLVFLLFGLASFFTSLSDNLDEKAWGNILILGVTLVWLLVVALLPRLGYRIRAISLVLAVAIFGLNFLITEGLNGSGRLYLLAVPFLAALLFSARTSIFLLILSLAAYAIIGFMVAGAPWYENAALKVPGGFRQAWLKAGVDLGLISTVVTLSLMAIMRRLQSSYIREKDLLDELDIQRAQQEHRILQRTQDLESRLIQIRNQAEVIHTIGLNLKLELLLPKVADLIKERFNFYFVGIYLLDEGGEFAVLRAATGEAGAEMLRSRQRIAINETSSVGWAIQNRQVRIAVDVGFEAVRFANPLLPLTRSELVIPLLAWSADVGNTNRLISLDHAGREILGALVIHSIEAQAFDQDDIHLFQEVADALAAVLVNARLIQQLEQNLEEMRALYHQYLQEAWKEVSSEVRTRQFSATVNQLTTSDLVQGASSTTCRVPLVLRDQEIGQLTLEIDRKELTQEERAFVEAVTTQAAVALENVRLLEKNQRQAGYERLLADFSRKVSSSTDLAQILKIALQELGQVLGASDGVIRLEIPAGQEEVQP